MAINLVLIVFIHNHWSQISLKKSMGIVKKLNKSCELAWPL
jgi:hypothetical protein